MHLSGEKIIPTAACDNEQQTNNSCCICCYNLQEKCLSPLLSYKGTTARCHPVAQFPDGWDIWHSANHRSIKWRFMYYDKIHEKNVVPFVCEQWKSQNLESTHSASVMFDRFRGQTSPEFISLLESPNVSCVWIPPNCTDKVHPLDISINRSIKSELRKHFQSYYANKAMTQLSN